MRLPPKSLFGDYQVIFKLRSNIHFTAKIEAPRSLGPDSKQDAVQPPVMTMQCKESVFNDLCELYPETAANIRMRALEKRDVFSYYMQIAKARKNKDWETLSRLKQKSTYFGDSDSSEDCQFHISKPFERNIDYHRELIQGKPKFAKEENYKPKFEEVEFEMTNYIDGQMDVLNTMAQTMKFLKNLHNHKPQGLSFAKTFKRGISRKHD